LQSKIIEKKITKKFNVLYLLIVLIAVCWSWLPLIKASKISNNVFVATIVAVLVFAIIISINLKAMFWTVSKLSKFKLKHRVSELLIIFIMVSFLLWFLGIASTIIWFGKGASIDNTLPFTSLTPFVALTPLKYLTRFFGYHGTTALLVTLIITLWSKKYRKFVPYLVGIILVCNFLGWYVYKTPNGSTKTVQIVAEQLGNPQPLNSNADLVVIPEYGLDGIDNNNLSLRLTGDSSVLFVGSKQTHSDTGNRNTLLFGSLAQGINLEQDKSRLIPGGEYLAYAAEPLLKTFSGSTYTNFQVTRQVERGKKPINPVRTNSDNLVVGAEACSSIINTEDYRKLTKDGATILTNSASLEIFRGSSIFAIQHRGLASFMAVANARPFAQSSNNWPAFALDHNGKLVAEIQPTNTQKINLTTNSKKTLYTILGEWPVFLGLGYLAAMVINKLRYKYRVNKTR